MNLLFFKSLISQEIVRAICWTLVHSLWQGLLLAIVAGIIVLGTRKSGSLLRYNLLAILFLVFLIGCAATFLNEYTIARNADVMEGKSPQTISQQFQESIPFSAVGLSKDKDQSDFLKQFINYFNLHASLVVTIWLIIFSARFVRVLANLGYIQRVRHYKTHVIADHWKDKLASLARGLEIKRHIALMESELIKVPIVLGFFKPLILVPFGLLAQLPMDQVEAILLHELAHIKRKDYLVNLLQSFSETIFFFNPAVLWISSLIREERENCCDDIAIGKTKRKRDFIQALVSFQKYQESGLPIGIAFTRNNNHLLNRIKRIVTNHNNTLNNMEKIFLASAVILTSIITLSFSQTNNPAGKPVTSLSKTASHEATPEKRKTLSDTVPGVIEIDSPIMKLIGSFNGKRYRITQKNNKLIELWINEERIPERELAGYQPLVNKITRIQIEKAIQQQVQAQSLGLENELLFQKQKEIADLSNKLAIKQDEFAREQNLLALKGKQDESVDLSNELSNKLKELALERNSLESKARNDEFSDLSNEQTIKQQELTKELKNLLELKAYRDGAADPFDIQRKVMDDREITASKLRRQLMDLQEGDSRMEVQASKEWMANQQRQIAALVYELERKQITQAEFQKKLPTILEQQIHKVREHDLLDKLHEKKPIDPFTGLDVPEAPVPSIIGKPILRIIGDLINEKIIKSGKNISFELNNKELIVNGRTQSEELHNLLKEKYIMSDEDHFIYSNSGNSTREEVHTGTDKPTHN